MKLTSVFNEGQTIPSEYTCDGKDAIPPLEITGIPQQAKSLALIMDDPDAPMGTWDHWIAWNIPPNTKKIAGLIGVGGKNSWGRKGYGGPCPPSGKHRYYFKLYALDNMLDLASGSDKKKLLSAIEGHVLEEATLMGTYSRKG
ncbi:YbhB/YbcL family Raf kinase inhibitor-like protein [Candidatus Woesearchaeota archaeon]|nr:YbhB/YbcL family Raf kinase inhibitor-like protein [Candidatus Woesearchaeota archaeon]